MINKDRFNEVKALLLACLSLLIFISLISFTPDDLGFYVSDPNVPARNLARSFGAGVAGILFFAFGWASYLVPLFLFLWAMELFEKKSSSTLHWVNIASFLVFFVSVSALSCVLGSSLVESRFSRGGIIGLIVADFFMRPTGRVGASIILLTIISISFVIAEEMVILPFFFKIASKIKPFFSRFNIKNNARSLTLKMRSYADKSTKKMPLAVKEKTAREPVSIKVKESSFNRLDKIPTRVAAPALKAASEQMKEKDDEDKKAVIPSQEDNTQEYKDYNLPQVDLLDDPPSLGQRALKEDLQANARILEETLSDFSISVRVTDIERGPVITRYELEPAPGVKLQKIVALNDDIALAMKAQSVRIVAPIPGKARVGIEVPNSSASLVYFKEVVASREFADSNSRLTLILGKDIAGMPVVSDLVDMPHLLIAGTTGSGKTVCVNSLIMSLLFKYTPQQVRLILIDPKMVELAQFNNIPHLLCPVITSANKVSGALSWVVAEMERRYQLLADAGTRNIELFNKKHEDKLAYLVVFIDELADLMQIAAAHIENAITRLAQLSRAVGIHLILATQRPSVDVITGVIKANFPARISFQVASKVDSRTVLDRNGADKLLGKGDLLFLKPGESKLIRAQGCLIKDSEIERVVEFIKAQIKPIYNEQVLKSTEKGAGGLTQKDEMFDEAVRVVIESNQASVSILQRRLRFGYTRAARLIDAMEEAGIVGTYQGSKPREILIDREEWLKKQQEAMVKNE